MAPLRPPGKLLGILSSDSALSSLPPSVHEVSNASTPLSSPPPSPSAGAAQASIPRSIAGPSSLRKKRAVLSSDDEADVSSLVVLEPSPVKRQASTSLDVDRMTPEPKGPKPLSASAESAPDSDLIIMGSSQTAGQRSIDASQGLVPTKPKKPVADDLDDLDDFDWGDDAVTADLILPSRTRYSQATSPIADTGTRSPSNDKPMSLDHPSSTLLTETRINGTDGTHSRRVSAPTELRTHTTPSRASPVPPTTAGSPTSASDQPPPSPTTVVMARIKARAEKEAALMSRLVATRSSESVLNSGSNSKGKRKALLSDGDDDDDDDFAMDTDEDPDFVRVGKRGRKQVALSDSDDDPLPCLSARAIKAQAERSVKAPGRKAVLDEPIGPRLRQKISTSSSSSAPSFVSRGKMAAGIKPSPAAKLSKTVNATASSSKFMASLLKKSSKRSDMLSRVGQIRSGGPGEDLSDSGEDDVDTARPAIGLDGAGHRIRPPPDATALNSSDDSDSSDEGDAADPATAALPGGFVALGSAADDISAVLAKDRLAKEARKQARREHRRKTWGGCWVRTKKKRREKIAEPTEKVEFVKEPWDVIRIAGYSEHPLFEMLLVASDEDDTERFVSYLALGALSPAVVATVDNKAGLVTALFESACLSSSDQRSALCLSHLLAVLRTSTPEAPVLSEKALFQRLTGAFQGMGYRHSLIESINRSSDGTPKKSKSRGQGEVFDLPFDQRCKAVRALSAVVEVVATHHLMNDSRLTKMICILILLSLDRTTPVDLKMTLEQTIALAVRSISLVDHEIKLSYKLAELSKDNDMTFKLGVVNALPRLGLQEGRLARALGIFFLGGHVEDSKFEQPLDVAALAALVSPDDRQSAFVVANETDYVQMISAIRLLAIVVGDFQTLFLPDVGGTAQISMPALQKITAGVKSLQVNLAKVEHRIMDARASNLDRSAAKAFLLNLNVSLGYRSTMFERMHQPRRAHGEVGRKGQTTLSFAPVAKKTD